MDLADTFALITDDEPSARAGFEQAWDAAAAAGDEDTALQSAAGLLLTIGFHCVDFRGRMRWCDRFRAGLASRPLQHLAAAAEHGDIGARRVCAAMLAWPTVDDDAHVLPEATLSMAATALLRGLHEGGAIGPQERLVLSKVLLDHHSLQMDTVSVARVLALQQEQLRSAALSPLAQAHWWLLVMGHHEYFGDMDAARCARDRLQALVDTHKLHDVRAALLMQEMQIALRDGQMDRAGRIHRDLESLMPDLRAGFVIQGLRAQASYLAQRGDLAAALLLLDRLIALCADFDVPERDQGAYRVLRANVLTGLGRFDDARQELHGLRRSQAGGQGELLEVIIRFVEAAARLDTQPADALEWLGLALADAARLSFNRFFMPLPNLAARLCQMALDAGIEPEFVRATIRERRLTPPDPTRSDWPWRIKAQVLGPMAIWLDGVALTASGKSQRKPLELLALLAAHGGGPISNEAAIDALWPSLEAEAPKASLEMAISRLRRLLDLPEAVVVAHGTVALDPVLVWCDAIAFEALASRLTERLAAGHAPVDELAHAARRLFALYRGRLLGVETLSGPMRLARERLSQAHQRAVSAWGEALERRGDWAGAVALYETALGIDALAEPIHRALMRALLARGERAEALRAYRRCRDALAHALGVAPARDTQELGRAAGASEVPI